MHEKKAGIHGNIIEVRDNGMREDGQKELKSILTMFGDVIKLKLDSKTSAEIEPFLINLKPDTKPVRSKQPRYPTEKKEFMERYVRKILETVSSGKLRTRNRIQPH